MEDNLRRQFEPLFSTISEELAARRVEFLASPAAYQTFIDSQLQPRWDVASTTSALLGKKQFDTLTREQQDLLVAAVTSTLRRYAFEGLAYYSGQVFHVADVAVSRDKGLGWVQVLMESPRLPDVLLDILVKEVEPDQWKAVDIRFKGITYVSVKKGEFREILADRGVKALVEFMESKNNIYFNGICSKAQVIGESPC